MVEPERGLRLVAATTSIEHVVIVFKENHGFDNYFGQFAGANGMTMPHSPNPPPKDPVHRPPVGLTGARTGLHGQSSGPDTPKNWAGARPFTLWDWISSYATGPS